MGFYEEIALYYDIIFPVGKEQLKFLIDVSGEPPKGILDIACGTGGYSVELAKRGYNLTSVDLDYKMTEEAAKKAKSGSLPMEVIQADMTSLSSYINSKYDMAFCIGNSLVHLGGLKEIGLFLSEAGKLLKNIGMVVFQIINYDRIIEKGIGKLPDIIDEKKGISFTRLYKYDNNENKIMFNTILKNGERIIENTIPLFPLKSADLIYLMQENGYCNIHAYGDFEYSPFDRHNSYMLVITASKA